MTIEDKKLLIQDLSCRLPYGVKCSVIEEGYKFIGTLSKIEFDEQNNYILDFNNQINVIDYPVYSFIVKPYLFPLTEENIEKAINESNEFYSKIISLDWDSDEETYKLNIPKRLLLKSKIYSSVVNYFYKHHIDYNGLIKKDLAIDASELDIY